MVTDHPLAPAMLIIMVSSTLILKSMTASVEVEIEQTNARIEAHNAQIKSYVRQPAPARYIPLSTMTTVLSKEEHVSVETVENWQHELTAEEVNLVAWVTYFEDNSDNNSRMAVAEVVLNRVESDKFQDTVKEVLYAPKQFQVMKLIDNSLPAPEENIAAVLAVFRDDESTVPEALFFAEKSVTPRKIARGLYEIERFGDTVFYGQK